MTKPNLKSKSSFLRFSLALFCIVVVIINGCRKEIHNSKQPSVTLLTDHHIDIGLLQRTYNKGINAGKLRINDVSQQSMDKIINSLNVDWSSYSLTTYPDSTQVVEFAMPDDTSLLVPVKLSVNDSVKYHSKTTAVFILRKDTVNMSFFMKTIEDGSAPGYQPAMNQLYYKQVPYTFTGTILYFSFERQFINGYKWENGAITKAIELGVPSQQVNSNGKLKTDNLIAITSCVTTEYDLYVLTIDSHGVVTYAEYIGSFSVEVCDTTYIDGGVDGDTYVPPPNPCVPPPPVNVAAANGKLRVDYVQPPPTGGSGGSTPCPPTINPTLKATIERLMKNINSLTTAQKAKLQEVLNQILKDCIGEAAYNYFTSNNVTFDFSANSNSANPASYNAQSGAIVIKDPSTLTAAALQEEFFHAYQNKKVSGGTLQYAGKPGAANIEFEAKVLRDMSYYVNPQPVGNEYAVSGDGYESWISSLTSGGTKFPKSFTSSQLTQYFHYMSDFVNQNPGYSSNVIKNGLNPTAMFNLIQDSPCSK